eukprot:10877082-Karenia_brevis.AAC.1
MERPNMRWGSHVLEVLGHSPLEHDFGEEVQMPKMQYGSHEWSGAGSQCLGQYSRQRDGQAKGAMLHFSKGLRGM